MGRVINSINNVTPAMRWVNVLSSAFEWPRGGLWIGSGPFFCLLGLSDRGRVGSEAGRSWEELCFGAAGGVGAVGVRDSERQNRRSREAVDRAGQKQPQIPGKKLGAARASLSAPISVISACSGNSARSGTFFTAPAQMWHVPHLKDEG